MINAEDEILRIVLRRLESTDTPTIEQVKEAAAIGEQIAPVMFEGATVDAKRIVERVMEVTSVIVDAATVLSNDDNHQEWLDAKRANINWIFWNRYRRYISDKSLPAKVVNNLDDTTDLILSKLEDPAREGGWNTRGLVVGRVQSGKTANYIGFTAKAIDAGYKVVIVLAGMHDNLRTQTQLRLDEGIYGHSTVNSLANERSESRPRIGVGKYNDINFKDTLPLPLTTSDAKGDFKRAYATQASGGMIGQVPIYLVVKKNKSVLQNVITWAKQIHAERDGSQQSIIRDIPLLLIDDEADNASINTTVKSGDDDDYNVSAINGKIRELLKLFEKSAYVGYTATPFANIYIPPNATNEQYGDDIFPRDFILNMTPPSNYIGPERVFGLTADGDEAIKPLPIVRPISDYETSFPRKHKKEHIPADLPDSLKEAIRMYVLGSAVRLARGHTTAHTSMLIHATRFVDVQSHVTELVRDEVRHIVQRLKYGDGDGDSIIQEFHELWNSEYLHTINRFAKNASNYELISRNPQIEWQTVVDYLYMAADKVKVKEMNGKAKDSLDYDIHKDVGLSVIAVGADKLARGLTLEGLTVSYFLRPSNLYDTLLQMGRWFGYRDGYLDVCRIYTTKELIGWYKHITQASVELFREFDEMAASGATPKTYGLKVLSSENGLRVTALNKMRTAQEIYLSYAGRLVELASYYRDQKKREINFKETEEFMKSIELYRSDIADNGSVVHAQVPAREVINYLKNVSTPVDIKYNSTANGDRLEQYISSQNAKGELRKWTVVLLSSKDGKYGERTVNNYPIKLIHRKEQEDFSESGEIYQLNKSKLLSPRDEYIYDLSDEQYDIAMQRTLEAYELGEIKGKNVPTTPNTRVIRKVRNKDEGLLLIYPLSTIESGEPYVGYVVSFPESETAQGIRYAVNQTHMELG